MLQWITENFVGVLNSRDNFTCCCFPVDYQNMKSDQKVRDWCYKKKTKTYQFSI